MTPETISLVQQSWLKVMPISEVAATLFYDRLFDQDPTLKPLFRGDMALQGRKLMGMITAAVNGLGDVPALIPTVRALGQRHVGYGVKPADYDTVGAALLWTLGQGLGPAFDAPTREAWEDVYGTLASVMIEAS